MSCQRFIFVDYIKFVGIYFIVLGHMPITASLFHQWIFSFHVPLFFFISGYLCKTKPTQTYKEILTKNFRQLIAVSLPYFTIDLIFNAIQDFIFYPNKFSIQNNLTDRLEHYFLGMSEMGPMWFLFALFLIKIVFLSASRFVSVSKLLFISTALAVITYFTSFRENHFQITASIFALPFFCLGTMARICDTLVILQQKKTTCMLIAIITLVVSICLLGPAKSINLNCLQLGTNIFTYYLSSTIGIFFISSLSLLFQREITIIKTLSSGTLVILCSHMWIVQICKILYKETLDITTPPPYMDIFSGIFFSLLIVCLYYFLIQFLITNKHRALRFLAGKQ